MDQQHRIPAARFGICAQQGAQPEQQNLARRQGVARRAGRAHAGAGTAAAADVGVDRHVVAGGRDRGRRADVEAAGAAGDVAARMGTQILMEGDVKRLIELADQVGRLEQRLLHRRRVARIGMQIAVPFFRRRDQRLAAGKIEDQIGGQRDAVFGAGEIEAGARRNLRRRVAVNHCFEGAEMAAQGCDMSDKNGHVH